MGALVVGGGPRVVAELEDAADGSAQVHVLEGQPGGVAGLHMTHPGPGEAVGLELAHHRWELIVPPMLDRVAPLVGEHDGQGELAEATVQVREQLGVVEGDEVAVRAVEGVVLDLPVAGLALTAAGHVLGRRPHGPHAAHQVGVGLACRDGRIGGLPERLEVVDDPGHEGVVRLRGAVAGGDVDDRRVRQRPRSARHRRSHLHVAAGRRAARRHDERAEQGNDGEPAAHDGHDTGRPERTRRRNRRPAGWPRSRRSGSGASAGEGVVQLDDVAPLPGHHA